MPDQDTDDHPLHIQRALDAIAKKSEVTRKAKAVKARKAKKAKPPCRRT